MLDLTIWSPALCRHTKVLLLTPVGYSRRPFGERWRADRLPTMWLRHGGGDDYTSWTRSTDIEALPELGDVLVNMPEGGLYGYYTDHWNGGAGGTPAWETFHMLEVRQIVERFYGAGRNRVIAGLSMGGFGALSYAVRHRQDFNAIASYSGVVHPLPDEGPE